AFDLPSLHIGDAWRNVDECPEGARLNASFGQAAQRAACNRSEARGRLNGQRCRTLRERLRTSAQRAELVAVLVLDGQLFGRTRSEQHFKLAARHPAGGLIPGVDMRANVLPTRIPRAPRKRPDSIAHPPPG